MKKIKYFALIVSLGVLTIFTMSNVSAAGWKSTLNLPYGTIHGGANREYGSGIHRINISVDGFNKSNGTVRKSGTTRMMMSLTEWSTARVLKYYTANYVYGTCADINMGTYSAGYKHYHFFSSIYNSSTDDYDDYDGIKSSAIYMYPLP